jgi:ribosome recycling factor
MKELLVKTEKEMQGSIDHMLKEFAGMRTGRASIHLLDTVMVNYYGSEVPLNQLATITAPEPTLLVVAPFDPSSIGEVEKAIHRSALGLSPINDGKLIRLPIPPLTEERRKELAKLVAKMAEESKTSIRNHRRDANDKIKAAQKDKEIGEDDEHRYLGDVQKLTDKYIEKVDELAAKKRDEIMQV